METKTINIKELKESFYNKLKDDKIKINWNKKPIRMDLFISFLNVELIRSNDHLGSNNGWTKLQNESIKLYIGGGIVDGIEYLDTLKYGEKLSNGYNNFVNPFYLFEIMNTDGQKFFIDYYKEDIDKILKSFEEKKTNAEWNLKKTRKELIDIKADVKELEKNIIFKENIEYEDKTLDIIDGRKIAHIEDIEDNNETLDRFYNPLYKAENYWY